ncbi:MAG: polyprenyl synthetase family protein, partial [Muribaculaceae bacterium]|nr:polyprenyl synthetase family protein [Muribaculaceae bacterium]
EEAERMRNLLRRLNLDNDEINTLIGFAKRYGGIEYAYSRMRDMEREGAEILRIYPDSEWKQSFLDLFAYIISRQK